MLNAAKNITGLKYSLCTDSREKDGGQSTIDGIPLSRTVITKETIYT